ncbi:MAG: molybdopterin-dependent oxidoreductase [Chloroflexi bacterium]|nr:molybdopterin-dependent oxidoreductase [Chloroflexota bacterium]
MRTSKALGILMSLALIIGLWCTGVAAQPPVTDEATDSITVTKYDIDGTTILEQTTLTYAELEASLPVQGDGTTRYYFQGPTFDPENLWDPDETMNLKNKGAVKGTDVKDLCELVGGATDGDIIQVRASDGYGEQFQYGNVYNPAPGQGKVVIAWYTKDAGDGAQPLYPNGAYVPTFDSGMQLVFLAETTNAQGLHVFGHDDMRTYLPEANWHYFYSGTINYPSANGLSLKWISEVNIYTKAPEPWSIEVTGAVTTPVSQSWFENSLACHEQAEWTDSSGNVWSGLPLWYLLGLADDESVHGIGSFNDALAQAGYDIEVRASDGYAQWFRSEDVARSSDYIVANKINGAPLSDSHFPLRLVGAGLASGAQRVGKIASINLANIPDIETWTLELSGAVDYTMTQAEFESAVLCPTVGHSVVYTDTNGDVWSGLPLWFLVGWVDDDVNHGAGSFNDQLAALGYQVKVIAADGYSYTFGIADVARNSSIIVANTLNGQPLPESRYPLRLVGSALVSGGQRVGQIVRIELLNLPTPPPEWELELSGAISTTLSAEDFMAEAAANPASWADGSGDTYSGVALWRLVGLVDDGNPGAFNDRLAASGYSIKSIASDGFNRSVDSALVARNDEIIVAHLMNDQPLPDGRYPLRLVGTGLSGSQMVSMLARIELVDLPEFHLKYLPLMLKH